MPQQGNLFAYEQPPQDPQLLSVYLAEQFQQIESALRLLADGFINKTHVAPSKTFEGMIRFADGTDWNPGSGEGVYVYRSAAWHLLG